MKKVFFGIIFILCGALAFAQENKIYLYEPDTCEMLNVKKEKQSRFGYSFSTGLGVSCFDKNFMGFGYVAPEIRYKVGDKFSLSGGMAVSYSFMPVNPECVSKYSNLNYTFYAKGAYSLTPKIDVWGAAAVGFSSFNSQKPSFAGYFGAKYKINEKTSIGITVGIRKDNSNSPFGYGSPMLFSPYSNFSQGGMFVR
ncbi:MAG: hypothetical protein HUK15_04825 [Bacteroidales bacterium]|nr:hypothetical protein [Bacteroidales bacterium]